VAGVPVQIAEMLKIAPHASILGGVSGIAIRSDLGSFNREQRGFGRFVLSQPSVLHLLLATYSRYTT
jgi:hypothetical protein